MRRLLIVFLTVSCSVGALSRAAAQDARRDAAAAYEEAQRAALRGEHGRAGQLFEMAYRSAPSGAALRSAIRSYHAAGQRTRAARLAFHAVTVHRDDAPTVALAGEVLAELAPALGRIDLECTPACTVSLEDGVVDTEARFALSFFVAPGTHEARISWEGRGTVDRVIDVDAGEAISLEVEAPDPPASVSPPTPSVAAESLEESSKPIPTTNVTQDRTLSPVLWVGLGVTVALAGVTTWSVIDNVRDDADYRDAPTPSAQESGRREVRRTWILGAAGAASLAATLIGGLVLGARSERDDAPRAGVMISPDGAHLSVDGRF